MPDLSVSMNWVEALTPSDLSNCPAGSLPIGRDKHLVKKNCDGLHLELRWPLTFMFERMPTKNPRREAGVLRFS